MTPRASGPLMAPRASGPLMAPRASGPLIAPVAVSIRPESAPIVDHAKPVCDSSRSIYAGMSQCDNCESFVTEQYVRVFAPTGRETVRVCPNCEDMLRDGAEVRQARAARQ